MFKKLLIVGVIVLFIGIGIQPVFGFVSDIHEFKNTPQESEEQINELPIILNSSGFADNIKNIICFSEISFIGDFLIANLLLFEFDFLTVTYDNYNDETLSVTERYEVTTISGRVIYNFTRNKNIGPYKTNSHSFMTRMGLFKRLYTFGPFKFTFEVYVKNDNSSKKVLFHGFALFLTAIIFDERGRII